MNMDSLTVKDIMTRNVIKISEDATISEMIFLFNREKITGAPVLNDKERLVGVVSLSDVAASTYQRAAITARKMETEFYKSWEHNVKAGDSGEVDMEINDEWKVKDIMSRSIITVTEETSIREAAAIMLDAHIHRVIVMNGSRIVGILSTTDILRMVAGTNTITTNAEANRPVRR